MHRFLCLLLLNRLHVVRFWLSLHFFCSFLCLVFLRLSRLVPFLFVCFVSRIFYTEGCLTIPAPHVRRLYSGNGV